MELASRTVTVQAMVSLKINPTFELLVRPRQSMIELVVGTPYVGMTCGLPDICALDAASFSVMAKSVFGADGAVREKVYVYPKSGEVLIMTPLPPAA